MREILFRGKRIDNGEWVYGNLFDLGKVQSGRNAVFICNRFIRFDAESILPIGKGMTEITLHGFHAVCPDTIGQYTGESDRNNNRIFEGDIVRFDHQHGEWGDIAYIIFEEAEYRWKPITNAKKVWNCRLRGEGKTLTVIGDIHDNPELLERKSD